MDKKYSNTKHRLFIALGATGVVLGISAAAFLASMSSTSVATATNRSPVVASSAAPSSSGSSVATPSDTPSPEATVTFTTNDPAAAEQFIENQTGVKVTLKPVPGKTQAPTKSTNGGSSSGSTSGSTGSTGSTGGSTSGSTGVCDPSNTKVWASCTAGYQRPKIVFAGVVSCTAIDRTAGDWRYTVQFKASGGNHNGLIWDDGGKMTLVLRGVPQIPASLPDEYYVTAYAKPMNGMAGDIDFIEESISIDINLTGVCK